MGCIVSKPKGLSINVKALTRGLTSNKVLNNNTSNYLFTFDITDLTPSNLKKIKKEINDISFMIQHDVVVSKIMRVLQYYINQDDINIGHVTFFYFHNKYNGKILQLTNKNASANCENDGIKISIYYFIDCDLDNILARDDEICEFSNII